MIHDVDDTIAAVACATGGAGRGIVRLSGPDVLSCLASFHAADAKDLTTLERPRCLPGEWTLRDAPDAHTVARSMPVSVYLWPTDRSYTRQPIAEIHTLGSPPLVEQVLREVCRCGARLARPGEYTLRAFLAGRLDLSQAEAVLGVIDAASASQLDSALQQLAGGLSRPLTALRDQLLNVLADVEAGLDFVDEDIEFITNQQVVQRLTETHHQLQQIRAQIGSRHQQNELPRVLLRGRPNVGKSTLWNALLEREAAIVSEVPGTTRDYLEETLALPSDQRIVLTDTAGVDEQLASPIDRNSQLAGDALVEHVDLILLCLDETRPVDEWESELLLHAADQPDRWLVVVTKADDNGGGKPGCVLWNSLPNQLHLLDVRDGVWRLSRYDAGAGQRGCRFVTVSAKQAMGLNDLKAAIAAELDASLTQESSMVASTATRCRTCIDRALAACDRAVGLASIDEGQELIAAEIRETLAAMAEVVGEVYTDDILDRVFSRFCIGK